MNTERMTLSIQVHNWIQVEYKKYDKKESQYTGDKYTEKVFKKASKHFKISQREVKRLYDEFPTASKQMKNYQGNFKKVINNREVLSVTKYHNKAVKLNTDIILKDKARTNPWFIDFVKKNKDTVFTAITDSKMKSMYTLKENDTWLFKEDDLVDVENEY